MFVSSVAATDMDPQHKPSWNNAFLSRVNMQHAQHADRDIVLVRLSLRPSDCRTLIFYFTERTYRQNFDQLVVASF